jgi:ATP-dependent DNA helicase RecG
MPTSIPANWLRKQRLVIDGRPTVCAEILFHDEPQTILPKSAIKIYRYKTDSVEGSRDTLDGQPFTIEGPAYVLIRTAVAKTIAIAESIPLVGSLGFEKISYPKEAIHEVITNAVIHRDYSIKDDIHVRIFNNRIEVQSPGLLPGHITVGNILDERFARNPKMVRLLHKFPNPPNKDIGEGLNTTFQAMRKLKLKEPIIEQRQSYVLVTLYHEPLGTYEELIVKYLEEFDEINNSKAREICLEGSENKVKRTFEKMMTAGLIERIPERRGVSTAYRLVKKSSTEG